MAEVEGEKKGFGRVIGDLLKRRIWTASGSQSDMATTQPNGGISQTVSHIG